ncbi:copper resistance protein B [Luteimonas terricola]|uniref:Copper resistance protein B n=1 Tax=Luteimonas terricola TaxID=645597 RepID=A0ABQ2ED65_9GAMM|nr:copper resistance protein B [Luteimonas terricola]
MSAWQHGLLALAIAAAVVTPAVAQDHSGHGDHAVHAEHAAPMRLVTPIPEVTDADRAAAFPGLHRNMEHARELNAYLLFNRLEAWDADHGSGQAWEAEGWIGGDIHRLWLRSEGERAAGSTDAANLELLYGRAVSPWWDVVAGLRHDFAPGRSRDWAAIGVQGLAPRMFEVAVTGYIGESGRTMLGIEVERELLLTNRLVLQPMIEATLHGKHDTARGIGSGLSTVEAGLRLRYEASRRFAPYLGVVHERAFGDTAALQRASGAPQRDTHVVIGARIWF